jgi:hypothetical protein
MLKFKKYRVRRFVPSQLFWTSSRTLRDFSHRTVKISHRAVNLMTSMQKITKICDSLPAGTG